MLNEMTMEKLKSMKLRGMSLAFEEQTSNPAVRICPLRKDWPHCRCRMDKKKAITFNRLQKKATFKFSMPALKY